MPGIRKPSPQPIMRNLALTFSPIDGALAVLAWLAVLACLACAAEPVAEQPTAAPAADAQHASGQQADAEQPPADPAPSAAPDGAAQQAPPDDARLAMWNSPEMTAARQWLVVYFNTTGRYSVEEARAYVERLSQLSPAQMRAWLGQIEELQARMAQRNRKLAEHRQWRQAQEQAYQMQRSQAAARQAHVQQLRTMRNYSRYGAQAGYDPRVDPAALKRAAVRERLLYEQYGPLDSLMLLNYLDVQDIRDDLRALRAQNK